MPAASASPLRPPDRAARSRIFDRAPYVSGCARRCTGRDAACPSAGKFPWSAREAAAPTPRFQYSGSTVSGPKKPKLPQFVAKFEPISFPACSAARTAAGSAFQRVAAASLSPPMRGSSVGSPRNVANARRMMRRASARSLSASGRIRMSGWDCAVATQSLKR